MLLEEKDLRILCEELNDAAADWKSIGVNLGVSSGFLQTLDGKGSIAALMEMLIHVLRNFEIEWEDIAKALVAGNVGRKGLAKKIRDKYCPTLKLCCDNEDTCSVDLGEWTLLYREFPFFMLLLF